MRRLRPLRQEEGATLVELLVVMVMMAVIGSIVSTAVFSSFRIQRRQVAQVDTMNELKLAFERVTRDARAADPLLAGSTGAILSVRVCRTGTYTTRTYRLQAGELLGPGGAPLTSGITNTATEPVFTYLDIAGTPLDIVSDPARINDVHYIDIRLRRLPEPGAAASSTIDLRNRLTIRNAGGTTCF